MMKLLKIPCLASIFVGLSWFAMQSSLAQGDWRTEREQGIRLEFAKNFSGALLHYKKALDAAPAANTTDATNLRLQLQCQIATCYLRQEQRLKALPYIDSLLNSAAKLRASNAMKADSEMYLVALVEDCDSNHASLAKVNLKEWQEYNLLSQRICELALPATLTPERYAYRARCFIAVGDRAGALKFFQAAMKKIPSSDPHYFDMQLKQAALENLLNQPEMLRRLNIVMAKTKSPVEVACAIGAAQTWATDYATAEKTLASIYNKLDQQKKLTKVERINLLNTRLDNSLDCGRWVEAEKLARQCLALNPPERIRNLCLTALSVCAARLGKVKEAAQLNAQRRSATFGFIEEEERDATAEIIRRRSVRK